MGKGRARRPGSTRSRSRKEQGFLFPEAHPERLEEDRKASVALQARGLAERHAREVAALLPNSTASRATSASVAGYRKALEKGETVEGLSMLLDAVFGGPDDEQGPAWWRTRWLSGSSLFKVSAAGNVKLDSIKASVRRFLTSSPWAKDAETAGGLQRVVDKLRRKA